jgi:tyrosyl-tRNA synthetase
MSKSLGNYIGINEPPEEIYGKTMSIPDQLTEKYVRLISGFDAKQQAEVVAMKPRDAKAMLAHQLVKRLHGEEAARRAEEDFDVKFRKHSTPEAVPEHVATNPNDLLGTLVEVGFAKSRGDARRLVEQGGIRINGDKAAENAALKDGDVLQAGKRNFVRIRVK